MVNSNIRRQWNGLAGSPTTNLFTLNSSILENKVGGGLVLQQDEIGISTFTSINLLLSYQIELSNNQIFSFGLQGGTSTLQHNQADLTLRYLDDPDFPQVEERSSSPNFGAGIALMGDNYYVGLSAPRLLNSEFDDGITNSTVYKRHLYATGAFIKELTPLFLIKPTALIKYVDGSPMSFDLAANIRYNYKFWFGLFTRNFNTQGALVQFILNEAYKVGYSIEIPTANHIETSFITHEISLGIDIALFGNQDVYLRNF